MMFSPGWAAPRIPGRGAFAIGELGLTSLMDGFIYATGHGRYRDVSHTRARRRTHGRALPASSGSACALNASRQVSDEHGPRPVLAGRGCFHLPAHWGTHHGQCLKTLQVSSGVPAGQQGPLERGNDGRWRLRRSLEKRPPAPSVGNVSRRGRLSVGTCGTSTARPKCRITRWRTSSAGVQRGQPPSRQFSVRSKRPASSSLMRTTADRARGWARKNPARAPRRGHRAN
jgi:hypothetical protein